MSAFRTYWRVYGGWASLWRSYYLLFALLFWALCTPLWFGDGVHKFDWVDRSLSVLPGMISFSLGALAIFLAFSNERFLKLLRQKGAQDSYLMQVTTAFFHFIIVQFAALILSLLLLALPFLILSGLAFLIFSYAILCGVAASVALLDMAEILNAAGLLDEDESSGGN